MASPAGVWWLFFILLPLAITTALSFARRGPYGNVVWSFSWENYLRIAEPLYLQILWRTVVIAFYTTLICLLVAYPAAVWIARQPARRRSWLLLLVIVPFWTNSLIRTYAWMVILRENGVINTILEFLGLPTGQLLYNPGAVLLGMVYQSLPFMVLPIYAAVESLDMSLMEAAYDLGATPARAFFRVMLPLTLPGVVAGAILVYIPALGMFVIPDLMGGAKTVLYANVIRNQFGQARNWPFGSALSVGLTVAVVALILVYMRISKRRTGEEVF